MLADRAEHQSRKPAVTALADHEQVRVRRLLDEHLRRPALHHAGLDEHRRLLAELLLANANADGSNPANLIVVDNRGLGASEGQLLGSVPAGVVRNAVCDVLVVQASALDEERLFAQHPGGAATDDDSRPVAEAQPEGGPPPTR